VALANLNYVIFRLNSVLTGFECLAAAAVEALEERIGNTDRGFRGGLPRKHLLTAANLGAIDHEQGMKVCTDLTSYARLDFLAQNSCIRESRFGSVSN
jgi:hypothetical protein